MRATQPHPSEFSTRDIYLATALKQAGIPIIRIENRKGKGIFVFQASGEIESLIPRFFNGELRSDPKGLFETFKSMKAMVYSTTNNLA
jgi:hypothetical protein